MAGRRYGGWTIERLFRDAPGAHAARERAIRAGARIDIHHVDRELVRELARASAEAADAVLVAFPDLPVGREQLARHVAALAIGDVPLVGLLMDHAAGAD